MNPQGKYCKETGTKQGKEKGKEMERVAAIMIITAKKELVQRKIQRLLSQRENIHRIILQTIP